MGRRLHLFFLFLFSLPFYLQAQCLSGNYTIGPSNADFTTINSAAQAMHLAGICGPVTFKVAPGTYANYTSIREISGSETWPIVFEGTVGDSNAVVISPDANVTSGPVMYMTNATNIHFRYVSFKSILDENLIKITGAEHLSFKHCRFTGRRYNIAISSSPKGGIEISNCTFNSVSFGGVDCSNSKNISILDNKFIDCNSFIWALSVDSLTIKNNNSLAASTANFYPIKLSSVSNLTFVNNAFWLQTGTDIPTGTLYSGITFKDVNTGENIVANNMLYQNTTTNTPSITLSVSRSNIKFYHNTIHSENSVDESAVMYLENGNNIFKNNIFSTNGYGYAINAHTLDFTNQSNHNNLYSKKGKNLAKLFNYYCKDLKSWQEKANADTNSVSVNPFFMNYSNLHCSESRLNGTGENIGNLFPVDIDNEPRNTAAPDIGADEFTPFALDAGMEGFQMQPANCLGSLPVTILLRNNGSSEITSATIDWNVAGVAQPAYTWSGKLSPGQIVPITIGNIMISYNTHSQITATVSLPNGSTDQNKLNDSNSFSFTSGLSGNYTIGGANPDYQTIQFAIGALYQYGVCGPVTFNIRDGVYNEIPSFSGEFNGSSSPNIVTFKSESNDRTKVQLLGLTLKNARFLNFSDLTYKRVATSGKYLIDFTGNCSDITISNSEIKDTVSNTESAAIKFSDIPTNNPVFDNITIANNSFSGSGYSAIYVLPSKAPLGLQIISNTFKDYARTIYIDGGYSKVSIGTLLIRGNYISSDRITNWTAGITLTIPDNFIIEKNTIYGNQNGIEISYNYNSPGKGIIANNFINVNAEKGIFINRTGSMHIDLLHNTVNISSLSLTSAALYLDTQVADLTNINNIYSNSGGGYAIYRTGTSTTTNFKSSIKNNYYTSGKSLASWNGIALSNLAEYITASKTDSTSLSEFPLYEDSNNLHILHNAVLSNAGYSGTGITTDIDGEVRNNPPDIGADEYTLLPTAYDAGVYSIDLNACRDTLPMVVRIRSFATDTLREVDIKAQLNNKQTITYHWVGKLSQFEISNPIEIGKFFVGTDTINVKAWTLLPNGGQDTNLRNDSAKATSSRARLGGTYTIGGTGADFPTLKAAANTLNTIGVCSPVVFKIADGKYYDEAYLLNVPGSSEINTITFESASLDSSKVLFIYKNYRPFYIQGKYFKIKNLGFIDSISSNVSSPGFCIHLSGDISDIMISNCFFQSAFINRTMVRIEPSTTKNIIANITIQNNYFNGPPKNVTATSNISMISVFNPFSSAYIIKGISIKNNSFIHFDRVVYLQNADSISFLNNTIVGYEMPVIGGTGIYLINNISNVEISSNKFSNIAIPISSGAEIQGIKVYNNFVQANYLFIEGAIHDWDICHNSVYVTNTTKKDVLYFPQDCKNIRFKNNIISKKGYGSLLNIANFESIDIDYNDYYSTNDTLIINNENIYTDFKKYQLSLNRELHSLNVKPNFVSTSDLHLNDNLALDNKGTSISEILTDIDGQPRNKTAPDMGADEFNAIHLPNDATLLAVYSDTVCDAATSTIYVKLKNNGTNVLSSVGIKHSINDIPQPDFNWNGTLQPDSIITLPINNFKHNLIESKYFVANTFNPNGVTDSYPVNDTVVGANDKVFLTGTYEIGAGTSFPTINSAFKSLMKNGVCGPVRFKIKDGIYKEKLTLEAVSGASAINTITFTSASNNYNMVTLDGVADTTLKFIGTDYVTLSNLTIKTKPNWGFSLMDLQGSCEHLKFDSVHFINSSLTSKADSLNSSVSFSNCLFESNIAFKHTFSQPNTTTFSLKINNSSFLNTRIDIYAIDTVDIINNRFLCENGKPYIDPTAISFTGRRGVVSIIKNYISGFYNIGIKINYSGISFPVMNVIVNIENNSISSPNMSSGITFYKVAAANVFYNSISCMNNTSSQNSGVVFNEVKNIDFKNNIVYNKYGVPVDVTASSFASSDYNAFYSDNNLFRYEGATNNFADYKSATGTDAHSIFTNPNYLSDTDLHYQNDTLNGIAVPIAHITDDLQNKIRDINHPNPGAFEVKADSLFDYNTKDLVLTHRDTAGLGSNIVKITFKNMSVFDLDPYHFYKGTIDTVDVSYEIYGQPKVTEQWIGKLELNQSADYTFSQPLVIDRGRTYPYTVSAHIHSSTAKDVNPFNDNIANPLNLPMAGVYTIGGTNPDFTSGDTAMLNLNACHESAAVTFSFRPGQYSLLTPQGSDTLKIISETGNTTDVKMNLFSLNASNITFKKVSLTLVNEMQGNKSIYGVVTSGKNIIIDSCFIRGVYNATSNQFTHGFYLINGADINITNNTFNNINMAIRYVSPQSGTFNGNHTIANNLFDGIYYVFSISGLSTSTTNSVFFHHNKIRNSDYGLFISSSPSAKLYIYNNEIIGLKVRAIVVQQATTQPVLVYNNFISGGLLSNITYTGSGNTTLNYFSTININNSSTARFINNSIYGSIELTNNAAVSFSNNSVFSDTAIAIKADKLTEFSGDYNNFYSNGNALALLTNSSGNANTVIKGIDSLKSVTTSNQNSISYNPYYTSATDLHSNSKFLKNKGKPDTSVTVDIDEQLRDTSNPDIGADEIDLKLDVVWPGDANGDSKTDNIDLLSIGLYNGSTGPARTSKGINWAPYESSDWGQTQFNHVDYKHADCNGDGLIDDNDTLAIFQNFEMRHNTNHKPLNPKINSGYAIYFIFPNTQKTFNKGDVVSAEIWLGKQNNEVQNCYGIAFNIGTYANCITPGSMKLNVQNNWIGTNQNSYRLAKTNENYGVAYGAIVRKDHSVLNGFGKIAEFSFIYNGNSPSSIPIRFENIIAIDNTGKEMEITPINEQVIVTSITSEKRSSDNLHCSPNPFSANTSIQYELANESAVKLELIDALGKNIKTLVNTTQSPGLYVVNLDAKENKLENGVYFIRLLKNETVNIIKVVITN